MAVAKTLPPFKHTVTPPTLPAQSGAVADAASEGLARVRKEKGNNAELLRKLTEDMSKAVFEKGEAVLEDVRDDHKVKGRAPEMH